MLKGTSVSKDLNMAGGSIQSSKQFDLDCQVLYCYFSGLLSTVNELAGDGAINHQKLVEILVDRDSNTLKAILQTYNALYGHDLLHFLANIQRNNLLARIAYLRMSGTQERDAEIMRHSMCGGTVNLNTLIEIACTRTSLELQCIKQAYQSRYGSDLEQDITMNIYGGFKEILLAVSKSCHISGRKVDMSMAMCDAKTLYEAIESEKTIDRNIIISLLSQRNTSQVQAILISYKQLYGHEFSKSLKRSKCGQFGKELRIVIRCMQYPEKFFAKQLRMKIADGHESLIRIITTQSEIDIKDINNAFAAKTGSSLENLVRREFNSNANKTSEIISSILIGLIKRC